jgi:uncharacterized protein
MTSDLREDQIEAYLRAHPAFLAERPGLYATLEPPRRVHGAALADHMAALLTRARQAAEASRLEAERLVEAGRAAEGLAARVQAAILALMQAADVAECVAVELPGLLGVDAASLVCEAVRRQWRTLPPGAIAGLLGGRGAVVRARPEDAGALHAEAAMLAEADALIRIPGRVPAMLTLACRDAAALSGHGTAHLAFLGQALGILLRA